MAGERDNPDGARGVAQPWQSRTSEFFARQLETLFREVPYSELRSTAAGTSVPDATEQHRGSRRPKRRNLGRYVSQDLADAVTQATGRPCSRWYIDKLRHNKAGREPARDQVRAIAEFFDVDESYFLETDTSTEVTEQMQLLAALRSAGLLDNPELVAARVGQLRQLRDAGLLDFVTALLANDGWQVAARAMLELAPEDVPLVAAMIGRINEARAREATDRSTKPS